MSGDCTIHPTATVDRAAALEPGVVVWHHAHVMADAVIGAETMLGHSTFVGRGAKLGRRVRVQNHVSIFEGTTVEDDVFIGPSVTFTNVRVPRAFIPQKMGFLPIHVGRGVTLGAGSVIVCPATIGEYAFVAAGSVVAESVPPHALMMGNPARRVGWVSRAGARLADGPTPSCPRSGEHYIVDGAGCRLADERRHLAVADPRAENAALSGALHRALSRVIAHGQYILGPEVEAFEREAEATLGVHHAVGVSSGTDALLVSLMALGVGAGDCVLTTPFSFVSSAEVIVRLGASVEFVDIDPETLNIDVARLTRAIEQARARPKAIVAVHLFGRPVDCELYRVAADFGIAVVEDAAQAFGATTPLGPVGGLGQLAAFSFFPTKNLGALGDAGLVTTQDPELAERVRRLRQHGARAKYKFDELGGNFRLDALQAAFLREKLPLVPHKTAHRRSVACAYVDAIHSRGLSEIIKLPLLKPDGQVFHQFVVRTDLRDRLVQALSDAGIGSAIHYPLPLHVQAFLGASVRPRGSFAAAERAAAQVLALPIGDHIGENEVLRIVEAIASCR